MRRSAAACRAALRVRRLGATPLGGVHMPLQRGFAFYSEQDRVTTVLRAKLREPKTPQLVEDSKTTRQARIEAMLQQALSELLDAREFSDPALYGDGSGVQIYDVSVSPCLRYATFYWGIPTISPLVPHDFRYQERGEGDVVDHLSPRDAALVKRTAAALAKNVSLIRQRLVSRVRLKVRVCGRGASPLTVARRSYG
jgi:hypothetical protein